MRLRWPKRSWHSRPHRSLREQLLRDPDVPNDTAELLVDHAMRALAADGVTWATLGLAPLAGAVSGWLRTTRSWSRPLFNFEGLASFKRKLRPQRWEPIFLAYPRAHPMSRTSGAAAVRAARRGRASGATARRAAWRPLLASIVLWGATRRMDTL